MIARVVGWSVDRRGLVIALWLMLAIAAAWRARGLQLDALPDLTNNQVQVLTRAPGLTPEEVELRVTRPIETGLGGLPGLATHRSTSRYGLSAVTVVFDDAVDPFRARQLVGERIALVQLPAGVEPPELGPMTGGLGEVYHFTLRSPRRTPSELLELAELRVVPALRIVPGIVEVNTWGGTRRTIDVRVDPLALAARRLTLGGVRDAIVRATGAAPGASLTAGDAQVLLRAVARPMTASELGDVIVARDADRTVRLADIAQLGTGARPRIGAATADGQGETVYVMAQMLLGANARDVTAAVRARMPAVQALLPPDVKLDLVYDRNVLIDGTLRTVRHSLLEGGVLVMAVLLIMLGSWRAGVLVALAIPLSMLGALAVMSLAGLPGNLMSLGAIDFGLLVDGAVVLVENVFHESAHRGRTPDLRGRIRGACQAVARPVFSSVLVIVLVYIPVLTLTGVDGKLFRPMAITVVLALVTALLLALTFVPATASLALRERDLPAQPPRLVRAIDRAYASMLTRIVRMRVVIAVAAVAGMLAGVVLFVRAGTELAPQLDEGDLVVQTTRRADISIEAAIAAATTMERAVTFVPEVRQVVSRIGSPAVATDVMGLEQADVFIALAPRAQWRPGLTRDALISELAARIDAATPGAEPSFTQPIQMRFNELLGGASSDVVVSVFGDDLAVLRRLADAIVADVARQPGVVDARVLAPEAVPLVEVVPRPLDLARAGLDASDVLDAVQALRFGIDAGTTYDGPRSIPIVLGLPGPDDEWHLGELAVPTAAGGVVRLGSVAELRRVQTPGMVQHDVGLRRLAVGFNVRGADLGSTVEAARRRIATRVTLPEGYQVVWGGQYENLMNAKARLRIVIPLVLLLIIAVLAVTFRRLRHTLVILTHVPFACVGGVVAVTVAGLPVSMSAAIGFIALSGIAVMNGVVLLSQVRRDEDAGVPPAQAVLAAARGRARPVLMTALVAALGFVPMMLATGVGAEVQRPLATVVVGGLITSTLLTLVVVPAVYPWVAGRAREVA